MQLKRKVEKIRKLINLRQRQKTYSVQKEVIGSEYGKWVIPLNVLNEKSVCYLAGAGEDISFDVGLAQKYNCKVFIFDPTPRAKIHFDKLYENTLEGKETKVTDNKIYQIDKDKIKKLTFIETGLWNKKEILKFYEPENPEHVSHSALNLQKTEGYFEAKVNRLSDIMKELGHDNIDLLKLDIEGAEYNVIDSIVEDRPNIKLICIEFDEVHLPLDNQYINRIKQAIKKLENIGYLIIDIDKNYNFSLIRKDIYQKQKHLQ